MSRLFPPAALATAALLYLGAPAFAAEPHLEIPTFNHLKQKASDTVDITISRPLLWLASKFAKPDEGDDSEEAQALELLRDVHSVRVRNYEFDSDDAYSRADIDAVRRQLTTPGWSPIVHAHRRKDKEDVDVYLCIENGKVLGLAVIASEPRSFTIVNIVGNIDVDKLGKLEGQFGIPRTSEDSAD